MKDILADQDKSLSILKSTERILNFQVADILDLSQLKSGVFRRNRQNFCLNKCILEIIDVFKFKAEQIGVKLVLNTSDINEKFNSILTY